MKTWLANLALLCVAVSIAAIAGEVALRVRVGTPIHWKFPQERYQPDPETGYWLEPDQHSFTHDKPVAVNSAGLRDREFAARPGPATKRVLALGDSQTFGNGLEIADTWPKQLEQRLAEGAGATGDWEVINAGLAGSNTWQHERMLVRLNDMYRPDVAVLGFYVNDVLERPADPAAISQGDRETNTLAKRVGYALKRSALFTALWQARHTVAALLRSDVTPDWETRILIGDPAPEIEAGWRQVERSLTAMRELADAQGVQLLLLVIPRRDQVAGTQAGRAFQTRIASIASRLGIPLVDPLDDLGEAFSQHGRALFIAWDGHNAALANAVLARALQAQLGMLSAANLSAPDS